MKRREFLKAGGVGLAASAVAAPAIAQSMPEVKWRLTSSFPKSLDTLWGASETFAKYCAEATDGKLQVSTFAAGEIVPGLNALDAVSAGTVDMCHTATYYFVGKDPTWALFCSVPFGPNTRQQNAWFYDGEGMKLMNEFAKKSNIFALVGGNTGAQMGGWFRKEIKTVADLKGKRLISNHLVDPRYVSRVILDGLDTGRHFTFQDFMSLGVFAGRDRHLNVNVKINHFSNGNIFTQNAGVKVPITFALGYAF